MIEDSILILPTLKPGLVIRRVENKLDIRARVGSCSVSDEAFNVEPAPGLADCSQYTPKRVCPH
jgi:hypothetical protein